MRVMVVGLGRQSWVVNNPECRPIDEIVKMHCRGRSLGLRTWKNLDIETVA